MPAGALAAVAPGGQEVWKAKESDQYFGQEQPLEAAADDKASGGPEKVTGGTRGRIAAMRRAVSLKMERPRLRTMGEIAAGAKAERELIEAEAQLGGVDVELARELLREIEPALEPRSYRERVRLAREGVRRVVEAVGAKAAEGGAAGPGGDAGGAGGADSAEP